MNGCGKDPIASVASAAQRRLSYVNRERSKVDLACRRNTFEGCWVMPTTGLNFQLIQTPQQIISPAQPEGCLFSCRC